MERDDHDEDIQAVADDDGSIEDALGHDSNRLGCEGCVLWRGQDERWCCLSTCRACTLKTMTRRKNKKSTMQVPWKEYNSCATMSDMP